MYVCLDARLQRIVCRHNPTCHLSLAWNMERFYATLPPCTAAHVPHTPSRDSHVFLYGGRRYDKIAGVPLSLPPLSTRVGPARAQGLARPPQRWLTNWKLCLLPSAMVLNVLLAVETLKPRPPP